jgi:tRNA uridine 5-carbamoylmethylation protein Kti12
MKELIVLIGPAGSGKSTWADNYRQLTDEKYSVELRNCMIISQDEMGKEEHKRIFKDSLAHFDTIIIDRMGFSKEQRLRYVTPAKEAGYRIKYVVFYVPRDVCFQRCIDRKDHPTIKNSHDAGNALNTFFKGFDFPEPSEGYDELIEIEYQVDKKKRAIICDLDGTLCNIDHRRHLVEKGVCKKSNWKEFFNEMVKDSVNSWCQDIINNYYDSNSVVNTDVILCSGRPSDYEKLTTTWLDENYISFNKLFMRERNDFRPDTLIKRIIYRFNIKPLYDILFCIDDRKCVVDAYRKEGLVVLDCSGEDF